VKEFHRRFPIVSNCKGRKILRIMATGYAAHVGFMVENVGFVLLFFIVSPDSSTFAPEKQQYKHTKQ
jgi:hypothetical protein